jgi:hypothetical protein
VAGGWSIILTRRRRGILAGAVVLGAVAVLTTFVLRQWAPSGIATVKIENQSDQTVEHGYVTVCDHKTSLSGLEPGATVQMQFEVRKDCHYDVRLRMRSGTVREATVGYVTRGLAFQDRIIVTTDGVKLGEARVIEDLKK